MRDELAERLLETLAGGDPTADVLLIHARPLQRMATYKYDEYAGFGPGVKFLESLVTWLAQFEPGERSCAIDFVRSNLLFISNKEIRHALSISYGDLIRPSIVRNCALAMGENPWRVQSILNSEHFKIEQRSTMFMGLADGARLDQFRRANRDLVHDQFSGVPELPKRVALAMRDDLNRDLSNEIEATGKFRRFVLIDDFSGSGYTMLRQTEGGWAGKLARFYEHLRELIELEVAEEAAEIHVLLYIATDSAVDTLKSLLETTGWRWKLSVVQQIPASSLVQPDSKFARLCVKYHDEIVDDQIKTNANSEDSALGFRNGRLPLVLSHNTPNNSVGLLWEHTVQYPNSSLKRKALFPRHERHKADR